MEAAGPSDSCLTQDEESSCDITGPQPNGHHPHAPSTEEESSNEPPVAAPDKPPDASKAREAPMPKVEEPAAKEAEPEITGKHTEPHCLGGSSQPNTDGDREASRADFQPLIEMSVSSDAEDQPKHTEVLLVSQVDCVNGNESMDSLDLQSLKGSSEAETRTPQSTAEGSNRAEQDEHKDKNKSKPTQEQHPQDGVAVTETVEDEHNKEVGTFNSSSSEQLKDSAEGTEEEPQAVPPHPPVVIDHQRLLILLDVVVKKSEGYSVEQLERLYSLLSQCIYKHRREYDKTQLLEEMEERIQRFDTFL